MNDYILESTLNEILAVIKPLREDWNTRIAIINELRKVVDSMESMRGAIVEPFGSFVSNLFTRWGDLDISIELPNGFHISSAGKKRKQILLGELLNALKQRGRSRRFQFIQHARVPVLKFETHHQNISCDISIDNMAGLMKSRFLFWIHTIDGRFRDMVLLVCSWENNFAVEEEVLPLSCMILILVQVKEWAKAHNINNPKSGTFNSYSLSLLVIFHFQTCVPPILPPLKDIYPGNLVDDLQGVRANVEKDIAEKCAQNIARFRSENKKINQSSLSQLFVSFIAKFSDLHLRASELGICPATGRWEHIANITRWLPKNHALFIEDPLEQPENSARAVSAKQLERISEVFLMTHQRLIATYQNKYSIVTTLTRQQISQFMVGPPVRYPNYNSQQAQQVRARPQVRQAMNSSSRKQLHQSQNMSHPDRLVVQQQPVQRPVQQYLSQNGRQHNSQVQQKWRPKK